MKRVLLAFAVLICLLVPPATAHAIIPTADQSLTMAYKYWGGYCNGSTPEQTVKITYDASLASQGYSGLATGVALFDDGTFTLAACTISILPKMDPATECRVIFHEVGHLAGHRHEDGGIMTADLGGVPFPLCDPTPREAVIRAIRRGFLVMPGWQVHCTPALTRCRASNPRAKHYRRFVVFERDADQIYELSP